MYDVLDVCHYVVKYSNEKDYEIWNLKLQNLLYFIQAYFLTHKENNEPCFRERMEAWDLGPIVPDAYNEYKQFGNDEIPNIDFFIDLSSDGSWESSLVEYDNNCISDDDKKLIETVVDKFADFSATDLAKIAYNQTPWKNAYSQYQHNEITVDMMKDYFCK